MSRTMSAADYRIRLSQLIAVPAPVTQQPPSICYPDRHRRTDEQISLSTLRVIASTLICIAIAVGDYRRMLEEWTIEELLAATANYRRDEEKADRLHALVERMFWPRSLAAQAAIDATWHNI